MNEAGERWQLRDYTIKRGELDQWIAEWRTLIAPLRKKLGFEVVGAWVDRDGERFIWLIRYRGERSFEEADKAYYDSPERLAIDPDPARHIERSETRFVAPLTL